MILRRIGLFFILLIVLLSACSSPAKQPGGLKVIAAEGFLADIAQHVAGDRLSVDALIGPGVDPHSFEPAPRDIARLSEANILIINGAGFEPWLERSLASVDGKISVVEASAGQTPRAARPGELPLDEPGGVDPHYWLDPVRVMDYANNIGIALEREDPDGKAIYERNAAAYIEQLKALDAWIKEQVARVPADRRVIVTNHESFGYFADRYGFTIAGTIIPSVSTSASPSAQQLAALVDLIKASGVKAIFVESDANPQLAKQVAQETGARVIGNLTTHALPEGGTYIDMMKANVTTIVSALLEP